MGRIAAIAVDIVMKDNQKEVIEKLREQGFRITKQREILIEIILNEEFGCCKEVYYLALKKDPGIGIATVYRTMDALEKVGALNRGKAYHVCEDKYSQCNGYLIEMEDNSTIQLNICDVKRMLEEGIQKSGLSNGKKVKDIRLIQKTKSEKV